ncbi:hypothetical protein BT63DRAFT_425792 [Microthyrium microscopicum]|uniref:Zn(2)-C6 fungal-type domain-containing protein n=1 Tax=Microthyrium microscopicum TaxID=703497 RepID=A0A6A6UAY4_9PEZI|nr:hypothetical protein BT63DRAFT_425792 [Microthyrium microscopicum]
MASMQPSRSFLPQFPAPHPIRETKKARQEIACVSCAKAKTKCDRQHPVCSRCQTKNLHCEHRSPRRLTHNSLPSSVSKLTRSPGKPTISVASRTSSPAAKSTPSPRAPKPNRHKPVPISQLSRSPPRSHHWPSPLPINAPLPKHKPAPIPILPNRWPTSGAPIHTPPIAPAIATPPSRASSFTDIDGPATPASDLFMISAPDTFVTPPRSAPASYLPDADVGNLLDMHVAGLLPLSVGDEAAFLAPARGQESSGCSDGSGASEWYTDSGSASMGSWTFMVDEPMEVDWTARQGCSFGEWTGDGRYGFETGWNSVPGYR